MALGTVLHEVIQERASEVCIKIYSNYGWEFFKLNSVFVEISKVLEFVIEPTMFNTLSHTFMFPKLVSKRFL